MSEFLLNPEQKKAVESGEGPLLIIAGAGTGKTRVITERITHLVNTEACKAHEVLALAFNNDAASELEGRVLTALPFGSGFPNITTFHAFCLEFIREYGVEIGLNVRGEIMEDVEQYLFLRKHFSELPLNYFLSPNPDDLINKLLKHFEALKKEGISPEEYSEFVDKNDWEEEDEKNKYNELSTLYNTYESLKRKEGKMDFSDLHFYALKILRTRPHILKKMQSRYKYILVDEYQDTDPVQNELVNLLAEKYQNLTVVGDDDQCIYRFRGASVENIMSFQEKYNDTKKAVLNENYRSPQEILDLAYKSIQFNNPHRLEVKLDISKKLHAQEENKDAIFFKQFHHGMEELDFIAKEIDKQIKNGKNFNDIAVLVRKTSQAAEVENFLSNRGVPCQFVGARGLYSLPEIVRIIFVIEAAVMQNDTNALFNYLALKDFDLPMEELYRVMQVAKTTNLPIVGLLEKESKNGEYKEKYTLAKNKLKEVAEYSREHDALQTVYFILETMSWKDDLINKQDTAEGEKKILNVGKFLRKVESFTIQDDHPTLSGFLTYFQIILEAGENPQTAEFDHATNTVTISTIHRSKGLEWPVVFLPYLVKGDFPTTQRKEELPLPENMATQVDEDPAKTHIAEERRLFYVALTRAQEQVYLSYSNFYRELKRAKTPSPFLLEIDMPIMETEKSKTNPLLAKADNKKDEGLIGVDKKEFKSFSYSLIEAYQSCPRKVYYRSIAQMPTPPSPRQQFGTQLHNVLQEFMNNVRAQSSQPSLFEEKELDLNYLLSLWKQRFTPYGYHDKEVADKYYQRGVESLTWFYEDWEKDKVIPLAIEKSFKVPMEGVLLTGRFDRIDPGSDENSCVVIDYKTGKAKAQEKVDKKTPQLTFYALAVEQSLGLKAEKLGLVFLPDQKIVYTERGEKDIDKEKKKIMETINKIKEKDFGATPGPFTCKYCDYNNICPYSQAG